MDAVWVNEITKDNERCLTLHYIKNSDNVCNAIVNVLGKILDEAKNGLYQLKVDFDFPSEEEAIDLMKDNLEKLGYNIHKSVYYDSENFQCISLLIDWEYVKK